MMKTKPKFEIWKTVTLGKLPHTAREIKKAVDLHRQIKYITYRAYYLLDLIEYAKTPHEVRLVNVTAQDLGITKWEELAKDGSKVNNASLVIQKAIKCGLKLCPAEVGPVLLSQSYDSIDPLPIIGMESVHTPDLPSGKFAENLRFRFFREREYVVDEWFDKGVFLGAADEWELQEYAKDSNWVFAL